jgi:hypothetical protein
MRVLAVLGLLGAAGAARAGAAPGGCGKNGCEEVPPPCPDCPCPCDLRLVFATLFYCDQAPKLIHDLHCPKRCVRLQAVKKLGRRLYANYRTDPEVLDALIGALVCDSSWEVRRAAAWSILNQKAETETAVLALYISSKMDPHGGVRSWAADALDVLTACRSRCWTELFGSADVLVGRLQALDYEPGQAGCDILLANACADCGLKPLVRPAPALPVLPASALRLGPAVLPDVGPGGAPEMLKLPTPNPGKPDGR